LTVDHANNYVNVFARYGVYADVIPKNVSLFFECNSGVFWTIFMIFLPLKWVDWAITGMNTPQCICLIVWWRHNCVISHVMKFYLMALLTSLELNVPSSGDKILIKNLRNVKDFLSEVWQKNFPTKTEKNSNSQPVGKAGEGVIGVKLLSEKNRKILCVYILPFCRLEYYIIKLCCNFSDFSLSRDDTFQWI